MFKLYVSEIKLNLSTITTTFGLFCMYTIMIPLLIGFSQEMLPFFHLGIIWVCILYAFLPERFYQTDLEDGTLELYLLSKHSLRQILLCKFASYWLLKIGGILSSLPILTACYHFHISPLFLLNMILGSWLFTLICVIHSSFTIGLKSDVFSGIQHFTTLPTLLPLILLLNQSNNMFVTIVLVGYLSCFMFLFLFIVPVTFRRIINK